MPHQNTDASGVTGNDAASLKGRDEARPRSAHDEPRSYKAPDDDQARGSLATADPDDYTDDGEALGYPGLQQGGNHTARAYAAESKRNRGPKTRAGFRQIAKSGRAD